MGSEPQPGWLSRPRPAESAILPPQNAIEKSFELGYGRSVVKKKSAPLLEEERALIPIEELEPGINSRQFFPGIQELADLIANSGNVVDLEVDQDLVIVSGERRYRACQLLNQNALKEGKVAPWPKLPCKIIVGDSNKKFDRHVAENAGRENLRFIEQARVFKKYRDEQGLDNATIGKKTGFDSTTVSRYCTILEKTNPKIIALLDDGKLIPIDVLYKLSLIPHHDVQLLRFEQWQGTAALTGNEAKQSKQRGTALSRRKQLNLISVLQEAKYSPEAIMVAQFIAGQRNTLPNQLHLKLSRKRRLPPAG